MENAADPVAHESRAIDEVIDRLQARFPHVPRERIREVVSVEHAAFAGRPIRDFVPVFVERGAADKLRSGP